MTSLVECAKNTQVLKSQLREVKRALRQAVHKERIARMCANPKFVQELQKASTRRDRDRVMAKWVDIDVPTAQGW